MYVLRKMNVNDLKQVILIDQLSFSAPWSPLTYLYEINQNRHAYMTVIERPETPTNSETVKDIRLAPWGNFPPPPTLPYTVVAMGGMWIHSKEAHISTLASHPDYRGQHLGELVFIGLVARSFAAKAGYVILEVRESNSVAQNLYRKYGFKAVKRYPRYYRDNNEDALLMELRPLSQAYFQFLRQRAHRMVQYLSFRDEFSTFQLELTDG